MAERTKVFASKPESGSQHSPGGEEERAGSCKVSSDLHVHAMHTTTHNKQTRNVKF